MIQPIRFFHGLLASLVIACAFAPAASPAAPVTAADQEKIFAANREKAKKAWDEDQKTFRRDFTELEKDYQEINQKYKSPEIITLLTQFIEKWKKGNRVGCATLYLAQKSSGELREKLLKQCVGEFSGCWYLDGTQVGGLGRLYLASYYQKSGNAEEAKKLIAEIQKDFTDSQDHSRRSVTELVKELE